jgi:hypothetical protein
MPSPAKKKRPQAKATEFKTTWFGKSWTLGGDGTELHVLDQNWVVVIKTISEASRMEKFKAGKKESERPAMLLTGSGGEQVAVDPTRVIVAKIAGLDSDRKSKLADLGGQAKPSGSKMNGSISPPICCMLFACFRTVFCQVRITSLPTGQISSFSLLLLQWISVMAFLGTGGLSKNCFRGMEILLALPNLEKTNDYFFLSCACGRF